jgi:hypothetical protein
MLSPGIVLFFLSPMVGELLSGSSPPLSFFNPFTLTLQCLLYGGGAILVRELTRSWGKGWPTLLVLGAAYGIIEEGLMCKSFFNPNWPDLGPLGSYGRWGGVNWVWSVELILYHALISIAIPIVLVGLLFPTRRGEAWAGRKTLVVLAILFLADVLFGFLGFPYHPQAVHVAGTILVVILLAALAKRLPASAPAAAGNARGARPVWFYLTGFLGICLFFFTFWIVPHLRYPPAPADPQGHPARQVAVLGPGSAGVPPLEFHPLVPILMAVALVILVGWLAWRMSGRGAAASDRHAWAMVAGALTFFVLLTPVHEMNKTAPKNMTGMSAVGLATILFLAFLARSIWRRTRPLPVVMPQDARPGVPAPPDPR